MNNLWKSAWSVRSVFSFLIKPMNNQEEEKSPILGSWRNVYALVIGVLVVVIVFLYFFMQHYKWVYPIGLF